MAEEAGKTYQNDIISDKNLSLLNLPLTLSSPSFPSNNHRFEMLSANFTNAVLSMNGNLMAHNNSQNTSLRYRFHCLQGPTI